MRASVAPPAKRVADVVGALTALVVLSPVFAVVALLVRMRMGSPVLFRQRRLGRHGRPFVLLKFRTMTDERDGDGAMLPDEQRLTPLGRWLRRTSLDELPELLNVLRGDMSLVGPRPLLPEYWALYTPRQRRRHEVLPGMAGPVLVAGRNAPSWEEKLELDVRYVEQWSLRGDLSILLRTIVVVITGAGVSAPGHATMPKFTGSHAARDESGTDPWAR